MRDPEIVLISLSSFFIALLAGLVFSAIFKKFKIPWAVALILGGIILGPHGFKLFHLNDIILFLSEIGVIFLMFIAGMETRPSALKEVWRESMFVAFLTGIIPAIVGLLVGFYFGYSIPATFLLAIILINSSFAVIIPTLEERGMLRTRIGKIIISSTMFQDVASLLAFSLFIQVSNPERLLPLSTILLLLGLALAGGIITRKFIPKIRKFIASLRTKRSKDQSLFEQDLRLVLLILIGSAIVFEFLNLETIVGAFFAGLLISEITRSKILEAKIHVLSYGVFVPIFFISVGAWADISLITQSREILPLVLAIVGGSILAKFLSGLLAGKLIGLSNYESSLVGATSIPQLITTLALALVGQRLEILPPELVTSVIILAIFTVIIGPLITNRLLEKEYQKNETSS
jgi:Kef-type K+ transport system membrane component KefB